MKLLELALLCFLILLNLYFIFLKDYFSEKAKNAATKEDIEEITTKIENIKNELKILHSTKKELSDQNKVALLRFYDEFLHWSEHNIRNVHITLDDLVHPNKIKRQIDALNLQQAIVEKAFWRLCLFEINNIKFIDAIKDVHIELENRHDNALDYLSSLEEISIIIKMEEKGKASTTSIEEYDNHSNSYYLKIEQQEIYSTALPEKLMHIVQSRFAELYK